MSKIFNDYIYSPEFTLDGPHLVEASAGTGKTYNIQNIYARLILEKGLRVSEIQVMTFTEAATKELRDRLRTVLADLRARYNNEDCPSNKTKAAEREKDIQSRNDRADKLKSCATKKGIDENLAKGRLELALLEFDNAAISTIHGFCTRALERYAFETNLGFKLEIDEGSSNGLRQAVMDFWNVKLLSEPMETMKDLSFDTLSEYANKLNGKTDWEISIANEDANATMLKWAKEIVQNYEAKRLNRDKISFDDILRITRQALYSDNGDALAETLRKEFKAALIDEFQDTDPVQYDIFKKVFMAKNIPLFFVGDPKQAIYFFRGGDIFTYKQAVENIDKDNKFCLDTNFRSTKILMDAINLIFKDVKDENGKTQYVFGDKSIAYPNDIKASSQIALKENGKDDPSPFRLIELAHDAAGAENLPIVLANEVVNTLNQHQGDEHPLKPQDIAILVNSHKNSLEIKQMLNARGVPCSLQKSRNVFASRQNSDLTPSPLAINFRNVLNAMGGNANYKDINGILANLFIGYSLDDVSKMTKDELADWVAKFRSLNTIWLKHGFGAAIARLEELGTRNGITLRERMAAQPDGERLLADYTQMLELTFAAIKEHGTAPSALLKWLDDRLTKVGNEEDVEAYQRELESENDAVRIMTMHASKGLQFPVVFLPNCNSPVHSNELPSFHDQGNENKLLFTTDKKNKNAKLEQEQERIRLLYVAMTRAIQRTVIIYSGKRKYKPFSTMLENIQAKGVQKGNTADCGADMPSCPIKWTTVDALPDTMPHYECEVKDITLEEAEVPVDFDPSPSKGSYSLLSPSADEGNLNEQDRDAEDNDGTSYDFETRAPIFRIPGGAVIGSCWHEILEVIDFGQDQTTIREKSRQTLVSYGFNPDKTASDDATDTYLDLTVDMIVKVLDYKLQAPDGESFTLKNIDLQNRLSEQEFNFPSRDAVKDTTEIAKIIQAACEDNATPDSLKPWKTESGRKQLETAMEGWRKSVPKGFMNGFVDLIFRHGDFYYIVDWKSNARNRHSNDFCEDGVRMEMATHGYFFQYLLYSAVLHRYLKDTLGDKYCWEKNFGGIRYYFLRGIANGNGKPVFEDRPGEKLLDELCKALGMEG